MKIEDSKPMVGDGGAMLSVRPSDLDREDGVLDADVVDTSSGGMSVAGCIATMYVRLLPRRFAEIDPVRFRGASANNSQKVWIRGENAYLPSLVTSELALQIEDDSEPPGHGLVTPAQPMRYDEYQNAIAATRDDWRINEDHPTDCPVCEQYGIQ